MNASIGGKWVLSKTHRASFSENRDYFDRLDHFRRSPILIYDPSIASSWLVSELSLALHIALSHLKLPSDQARRQVGHELLPGPWPEVPYALPLSGGGQAAYDVCKLPEITISRCGYRRMANQKHSGAS